MLTTTNDWTDVLTSSYEGKTAVVYFTAAWCQPCRTQKPQFAKASVLDKNDNVEYFIVDIDEVDPHVLLDHRIMSVPTIMWMQNECDMGTAGHILARKADEIVTEVSSVLG
jgi:thiol:disulfide interchange protein